MKETPMWVGVTYLLYCICLLGIVLGGTMYAVFALGFSGWWLAGAVLVCTGGYSPARWHGVCTGIEPVEPVEDTDDDEVN
jgi:hypothetical protein